MAVHRLGSTQLARAPYLVIPKDIFSSRTKREKFTFYLAFYRLRRRWGHWGEQSFFLLTALLVFVYRITLKLLQRKDKRQKKRHLYPKGQARTGPKDPCEVLPQEVKREKKSSLKKP